MLPEMSCNIEYLNLSETAIEELSPAIDNLSKLVELSLRRCSRLKSLPTSICKQKSLERLFLCHCSKIDKLPDEIGALESFITLDIAGTAIREVPLSIVYLKNLKMLSFKRCKVQDWMMNLLLLPSLGLCSLKKLDLTNCGIANVPDSLCSLKKLDLTDCGIAKIPEKLYLGSNKFESIPANIANLFNLEYFDISYCQRLHFLLKLPSISINAINCILLEVSQFLSVPYTITCASKFYVNFANCFKILPVASICFPGNETLEWFSIRSSGSLITEELPPGWNSNKFVGFALCAVMETQHNRIVNSWDLYICCECNLKSKDGHWHVFIGKFDWTRHVECCKVKSCGVRLMYAQDLGKSSASFSFVEREDEP
ncbi:hypothetical protein ACOSQ4_009181 [Xanthoceras sorbifolium]